MPCLSGTYNPEVGILVQVAIVPGGHVEQIQDQGSDQPPINAMAVAGLMDTGADATCISPNVVQQLSLVATGKIQTAGVTGVKPANQYTVDLILKFGANAIAKQNMIVTEYAFQSSHFDVLIGRDIICSGVLTMEFSGRFSFSV